MGNAAVSLENLLYRAHKFAQSKPLATWFPLLTKDTCPSTEVRLKKLVHSSRTIRSNTHEWPLFRCSLFISRRDKYIHRESLDTDR